MPLLASRLASFGPSIFAEMSRLAIEHQAINLGQGFPDFDGPDEIKHAAQQAIANGENQYAQSPGQPVLRAAIATHARRFYGQELNPDTEITVTCGASEALMCALLGLVNPGDEVVMFEPYFDVYVPDVLFAGGVPRFVPLRTSLTQPTLKHPERHNQPQVVQSKDAPPTLEWHFDPAELRAAFNNRTRVLLLNTPHNPTGKVFTREELLFIAELCEQWNVTLISDEVYEHLVFDGQKHLRPAQLPELAHRTLTISSQGKTFSFTGWKTGWAVGPAELTTAVRRVHQFSTFASATPFQSAVAQALALPDAYYQSLIANYQARRDFLAATLQAAGLTITRPAGTYFIMANFAALGFDDDVAFCRWLTSEIGVAAIPPSAFYGDEHKALGQRFARFAFCKRMETLEKAAERLQQMVARRGLLGHG